MPLTDPTRSTPPLSDDFPAAIDSLLPALQHIWRRAFGYELEPWQVDLLRRITEVFPAGHPRAGELRFRQVLISVARQNGKSELAAALGLWGLLRGPNLYVVGIARTAEQARLVYKRALAATALPALKRRMTKMTDTRGIETRDGSRYELKASTAAALQGLPVSLGVVDEVHLLKEDLWDALVSGTGGRPDALLVGITTAGDDDSALLKRLYEQAEESVQDPSTRFGAFIWEADSDQVPEDDTELLRLLRQANPALASGRLDADNVLSDVRSLPKADIVRYRLNRFTSSTNAFISAGDWAACASRDPMPTGHIVFALDRTPEWSYGSVVAASKDADGFTHTTLVASLVKPNLEQFIELCERLALGRQSVAFVCDRYQLGDLAKELTRRGLKVYATSGAEVATASSMLYAKALTGKIKHDNAPLLAVQMPRAIRRNVADGFRINRKDSSIEIDAVMSTAFAIWGAEVTKETPMQLFF